MSTAPPRRARLLPEPEEEKNEHDLRSAFEPHKLIETWKNGGGKSLESLPLAPFEKAAT